MRKDVDAEKEVAGIMHIPDMFVNGSLGEGTTQKPFPAIVRFCQGGYVC